MTQIIDNKDANRYEMVTDGHMSVADYRLDGNTLYITHVEVPKELRGKGIAAQIMEAVLADAGKRGLHIEPICSYAATYMARHKL